MSCVRIQRTWAQHADRDIYSASAVDSAVQSCFFDDQLTSFSPKNCAAPDVLFAVTWSPAWSASEKAVRLNPESFVYFSTKPGPEWWFLIISNQGLVFSRMKSFSKSSSLNTRKRFQKQTRFQTEFLSTFSRLFKRFFQNLSNWVLKITPSNPLNWF